MVYVPYSLNSAAPETVSWERLSVDLPPGEGERIRHALEFVEPLYSGRQLTTGEEIIPHVIGMALIAGALHLDTDSRLAALLFAVHEVCPDDASARIEKDFGADVSRLLGGLQRLNGLRLVVSGPSSSLREIRTQPEILRKMVLALSEDVRVILLHLASRTQTLRYYLDHPGPARDDIARESLDIYAPLANRLGVWEVKWEIEDLSFRFLDPDTYRRIARQLDEKRVERERFIVETIALLKGKCTEIGIDAEIYGRPKHIYSIWRKMRAKRIPLEEVYDLHAIRVIVKRIQDCYTVLGIVHQMWLPIAKEFDDYITKPKNNLYQSLHTAVMVGNRRPLEVQIRTWDMHENAELGVAAHWRYKEGIGRTGKKDSYADKVALLRELLSWRDDVTDTSDWIERLKHAALDDTVYVLTPQGRVVNLPHGATPVDFAYHVHTQIGHRCRGAKTDGTLVALNTPLVSGQTVEIITVKQGGPSRDWLNPQLGYLKTARAKTKVRQYFVALDVSQTTTEGRAIVHRELQREGATQINSEELAARLNFANAEAMFLAAGRGELGHGSIQHALCEATAVLAPNQEEFTPRRSRADEKPDGVLIVGMDRLMTQLGRCCKPVPPDLILRVCHTRQGNFRSSLTVSEFHRHGETESGKGDRRDLGRGFKKNNGRLRRGYRSGIRRSYRSPARHHRSHVTGIHQCYRSPYDAAPKLCADAIYHGSHRYRTVTACPAAHW